MVVHPGVASRMEFGFAEKDKCRSFDFVVLIQDFAQDDSTSEKAEERVF
jgi:hypothetical protein